MSVSPHLVLLPGGKSADCVTVPMMLTAKDLADLLRHKREYSQLTQQQVAELCKLHKNTVTRWEAGDGLETVVKFFACLEACGCVVKVV